MEQSGRRLEQALRALAVGDRELARSQVTASLAMHRQPLAQAIKDFLDSDACCVDSGRAEHTPWVPAGVQVADEPEGVRHGECWNPDSVALRM